MSLFWAFLFSLSSLSSTAFAKDVVLPNYPYANPLVSTLTSQLLFPTKTKPTQLQVELRSDRSNVQFMKGREHLDVGLFAQTTPARLIILVGGVGSTSVSGASGGIGEQLYNAGNSVLILPGCMSWQFTLGASTNALPGYTTDDVQDLQKVLQLALQLPQVKSLKITGYSMVGYSLGALDIAFLAPQVEKNLGLQIDKVVMINPPVDLAFSIAALDSLYAQGDVYTEPQKDAIMGDLLGLYQKIIAMNDKTQVMGHLDQYLHLNATQLSWVIGNAFHGDMTDALFASQQIIDRGVLPGRASDRVTRSRAAKMFGFAKYMQAALFPVIKAEYPNLSEEDMIYQSSLLSLKDTMSKDSRYRVIETADDLIVNNEGLDWLRDTFGDRATIFDHGGHLGEALAPRFYVELFADLN